MLLKKSFFGKKESPHTRRGLRKVSGDDLLSHPVAGAVPSALRGLTAEFGMGSGDPPRYGRREKDFGQQGNESRSRKLKFW